MTTLPALVWLAACAREEPAPVPVPDSARFEGHAHGGAATDELVLARGDADVCRWLFAIDPDPDATPPCGDPDGGACAVAVVGWRVDGRPRLGGCALLGYTAEAAGEAGLLGVGWSDAWRVAGVDQGPGLAWWDGAEWILIESGDSSWDPMTGTFTWELPGALPE